MTPVSNGSDSSCRTERGLSPWQWRRRETCSQGPSWCKDPGGTRSSEGGAAKTVWTEQPSPAGSRHKAAGQRRTSLIKLEPYNKTTKIKVRVNRHVLVCQETAKSMCGRLSGPILCTAHQTDLIKNAAHPVKENLEEVAFEERKVQVTLLKRLWVPPPVPV